jgi:hypothetical protein
MEQNIFRKKAENLQVGRRKNLDLKKLKNMGGPFTKPCEVDMFINYNTSEAEEVNRLYTEVHYNWDNCVFLPDVVTFSKL